MFDYTPYYCEENIYKLADKLETQRSESLINDGKNFVDFISSVSKLTSIWFQKLSENDNFPVFWDYHVILVQVKQNSDLNSFETLILDFDSKLAFPIDAIEYITKSFQSDLIIVPSQQHLFRVIAASDFLNEFASDRSHMNDTNVNSPQWECIRGKNSETVMNLTTYIELPAHFPCDLTDYSNFIMFDKSHQ